MSELLIGCGGKHDKLVVTTRGETFTNLFTLDINPAHNPDVVWDLEVFPYPFPDDTFDEVHGYEVLEHTGEQGDYLFFFRQFEELWRILKPDGVLAVTVPARHSPWVWGDPGHKRAIVRESLVFLDQTEYVKQVGVTAMSDYRFCYNADFAIESAGTVMGGMLLAFILRAVKPSRKVGA